MSLKPFVVVCSLFWTKGVSTLWLSLLNTLIMLQKNVFQSTEIHATQRAAFIRVDSPSSLSFPSSCNAARHKMLSSHPLFQAAVMHVRFPASILGAALFKQSTQQTVQLGRNSYPGHRCEQAALKAQRPHWRLFLVCGRVDRKGDVDFLCEGSGYCAGAKETYCAGAPQGHVALKQERSRLRLMASSKVDG